MQISVSFENTTANADNRGPVKIGWFYNEKKSSVVFEPPSRVRSAEVNREHAKSASRCPAIINLESRYFQVKCPFDLKLALVRDKDGKPGLKDLSGAQNATRQKIMRKHLFVIDEKEWRYKDRPTIQLMVPYVFISDEPVYMSQIAPYMSLPSTPWPGTLFGGRFPINVWPRPLMWAFEWHDVSKPLILKRGEPLFYAQFETLPQERAVQLVECEETQDLKDYMEMISGAVNYVNQTFSLFKAAQDRRPETLVVPKSKS